MSSAPGPGGIQSGLPRRRGLPAGSHDTDGRLTGGHHQPRAGVLDDSLRNTTSSTEGSSCLHATWKCATSGLASDRGSEQRDLTLLGSLGGCSFASKHRAWFRFSGSREHGPIPELTNCSRTAGPDGQFGDCNGARSSHPSGELWGEGRALAVRRSSGGRTHACLDLPACPSRRCAEYHPLEFGHGAHHPQHCFRLPITSRPGRQAVG